MIYIAIQNRKTPPGPCIYRSLAWGNPAHTPFAPYLIWIKRYATHATQLVTFVKLLGDSGPLGVQNRNFAMYRIRQGHPPPVIPSTEAFPVESPTTRQCIELKKHLGETVLAGRTRSSKPAEGHLAIIEMLKVRAVADAAAAAAAEGGCSESVPGHCRPVNNKWHLQTAAEQQRH